MLIANVFADSHELTFRELALKFIEELMKNRQKNLLVQLETVDEGALIRKAGPPPMQDAPVGMNRVKKRVLDEMRIVAQVRGIPEILDERFEISYSRMSFRIPCLDQFSRQG